MRHIKRVWDHFLARIGFQKAKLEEPPATVAPAEPAREQRRRRADIKPASPAKVPGNGGDRLSQSDIAMLRADPTAEARALVARKLGEQADTLVETGHTDLVNEIFGFLVKDVEAQVRRSLAEAMASSPNLPLAVARTLARDDIDVARPILEESPVLGDEDLIEIVRTSAIQYSLAVAARDNVSENVSEALVNTGHRPVVARLLENDTAKISDKTYQRVLDDYGHDKEVQERLVKRMDLPGNVVERLTATIGKTIESSLIRERGIDAATAKDLMKTATQNATIIRVTRDSDETRLRRYMREQYEAGELTHDRVLWFLRAGDIASLEVAMSILAGVDVKHARRMLYHEDHRRLMALCMTAEFSAQHYVSLQAAVDAAENAVATKGTRKAYSSKARSDLCKEYQELARNPETMAELFDLCAA